MADIFDKIAGGLGKGVSAVGAGSKAMMEKANVNSAIKNLEEQRKQIADRLGMKVYNTYISGEEIDKDEISGFISEISTRVCAINEYQEQLKRIEEEKNMALNKSGSNGPVCTACGHVNAADAKFCAKCGGQCAAHMEAPVATGITACACGHVNAPDAKFCAKCGKPL